MDKVAGHGGWRKSSHSHGDGNCVEVWRKSSYSAYNGSCVEMAWRASSHSGGTNCVQVAGIRTALVPTAPVPRVPAHVLVRDSKDPDGPRLKFTPAEWTAFLGEVRSVTTGWSR